MVVVLLVAIAGCTGGADELVRADTQAVPTPPDRSAAGAVLDDAGCEAAMVAVGAVIERPRLEAEGADRALLDELDAVAEEARASLPVEIGALVGELDRVVERHATIITAKRERVALGGWPPDLRSLEVALARLEADVAALPVDEVLVEPCRGRVRAAPRR
jgi:hypothetical protein